MTSDESLERRRRRGGECGLEERDGERGSVHSGPFIGCMERLFLFKCIGNLVICSLLSSVEDWRAIARAEEDSKRHPRGVPAGRLPECRGPESCDLPSDWLGCRPPLQAAGAQSWQARFDLPRWLLILVRVHCHSPPGNPSTSPVFLSPAASTCLCLSRVHPPTRTVVQCPTFYFYLLDPVVHD